jgi:uncharacterized repeat protein (TIGR03803 family)
MAGPENIVNLLHLVTHLISARICITVCTLLCAAAAASGADLVTLQAESGALGANFATVNGTPSYITTTTDGGGGNPGTAARVASYTVTFPSAGTYKLYVRLRVGPAGANDDSFFYGNGFSAKSPTSDLDWILVNNIYAGGFVNESDLVTGSGSEGVNVWKWINFSESTGAAGEPPISFTVPAGNLTQTFQIGARENGLDFDKLVFGSAGSAFTVAELDNGLVDAPLTNAFPGPDGIAIHRFGPLDDGVNADGANPGGGLAWSGEVLVGATVHGGEQGTGAAFHLSPDGMNFQVSRAFGALPDANHPRSGFFVSGADFYGASRAGGSNGAGTVFAVRTNGTVTVLRHFTAVDSHTSTNVGGASPVATLALAGGRLYGTAMAGGSAANGTIFSVATNGGTFSVLHQFSRLDAQTGTNIDGAIPLGGLMVAGTRLYGTTSAGGAGGQGVVFSIDTNGTGFATLHSFSPMDAITATNAGGAIPCAGLVLSNGTLFGTTLAGGNGGRGTVFSLQTNGGDFTVLHHFTATDAVTRTNADGASPAAALTLDGPVLYGTASAGGNGAGTVFSLNTSGTQFTTLHRFGAVSATGTNAYGAFPVAPALKLGQFLYGTAYGGGPGGAGTAYRIPLPPPPAVITAISNQNGTVTIYFAGTPNSTNVIQTAIDLSNLSSWQAVATNVADVNGTWQFTDAINSATRFYRSYAP